MAMTSTLAFFGGSPGAGEMLVIFAVVLLLFGARRLPEIARGLGRALEEFRRAARDLTRDVMSESASARLPARPGLTPPPESAPGAPPSAASPAPPAAEPPAAGLPMATPDLHDSGAKDKTEMG